MSLPTSRPGDKLKRAIQEFSDIIQANPDKSRIAVLNEVITKYDLSPKDGQFLRERFKDDQQD